MKPVVNLYKLGRLPYVKALNVQQVLFEKLKDHVTSPNYEQVRIENPNKIKSWSSAGTIDGHPKTKEVGNSLILVEHQPVYTVGIRSKQYNDKYVSQLKYKLDEHKLKADFVETNRGGLITFHGPGQMVAYPIIYLGDFTKTIRNRSVKAYVNLLESTIIDTLTNVGIEGAHTLKEYPGVWLDNGKRKIAFIGIACKRFVTMHGISINCDCDLLWFDHIVSCGIEDRTITSVRQELLMKEQILRPPTKTEKFEHETIVENRSNSATSTDSICSSDTTLRSSSKSDIESISNAFCDAFSQHFNCRILEDLESTHIQSHHEPK